MAKKPRSMDQVRRDQQKAAGRGKGDAPSQAAPAQPQSPVTLKDNRAASDEFERQAAQLGTKRKPPTAQPPSAEEQEFERQAARDDDGPFFSPREAAREHGIDPDEHNARVAAEREFERQTAQQGSSAASHDRPQGPSIGGDDPMSREQREPDGNTAELLERMVTALEQMAEDVSFLREDIDRLMEGF